MHGLLEWTGDPSSDGDSVPLRLCGALHALALRGDDADLAALYASPETSDGAWATIERTLRDRPAELSAILDLPPQTNEVARSGALWPSLAVVAARTGLPLALFEVGASAGLNLNCNRFAYDLNGRECGLPSSAVRLAPAWRGAAFDLPDPIVASRVGCDLRPYDLTDPAERRRLTAYTWPDQPERLARQRAAIEIATRRPPGVERADAVDWLRSVLALARPDACRTVYTTIAWQYLPEASQRAGEAVVAAAGARALMDGSVAFVCMEADGREPGAGLTLDLWTGTGHERVQLGRADFHGRWVDWRG